MYDVFISYSTRGLTTKDWLVKFVHNLELYYESNYSKKLRIWIAINENKIGDNFESKIFDAIQQSLVFLMILEPAYIQSPETIKELEKYKSSRKDANLTPNYISIIKWRGNKESSLKSLVDSNMVVCYLSKFNNDKNEELYQEDSTEYLNEIQNIAKAIRTKEFEESRKVSAEHILAKLEKLNSGVNIYVSLGNATSGNGRSQFINQLTETIKRVENLKQINILPDCLISDGVTSEDLSDLLEYENPNGKKCLQAMLGSSKAALVLFLSDKTNEAEDLLKSVRFQLNHMKAACVEGGLSVTILAIIPKELYGVKHFAEVLDSSQYKSLKVVKQLDISSFIDFYLDELKLGIATEKPAIAKKKKHIYIVEDFITAEGNEEQQLEERKKLDQEIANRRKLRNYITNKEFVLIPYIKVDAKLEETMKYHNRSLSISDGILIYRGIREEPDWCIRQQFDSYSILIDLEEENKVVEKAVYVDPLQQVREREEYFYFGYDVILEDPKELDNFLCKIQEHNI